MATTNSFTGVPVPEENIATASVATPPPEPHDNLQPVSQALLVESTNNNSSQARDSMTVVRPPQYRDHPAAARPPVQPFDRDIESQAQAPSSSVSTFFARISDTQERFRHSIAIGSAIVTLAVFALELWSTSIMLPRRKIIWFTHNHHGRSSFMASDPSYCSSTYPAYVKVLELLEELMKLDGDIVLFDLGGLALWLVSYTHGPFTP